jgi:EAL domain-containing protein (putative c-di-GMP-specific phosphodiesterase class I)
MTDQAGEIVAAGHLIPIAEKLGLVRLIDRAVVQMTVAALSKYPDARLSFNVSGTTATDPRWYVQILEILESNRRVCDRLIIEITETVALGDLRETIKFVEQLRGLGCAVAIDDFGAGYTSFRNLRAMPVDVLKLDGTFCSNLSGNGDNQYFVRSLIDLARTFGLRTVAEWVENEEDAALLRSWGVDMMQGNLFGDAQLTPPWTAGEDGATPADAVPFALDLESGWPMADEPLFVTETAELGGQAPADHVPMFDMPEEAPAAFAADSETVTPTLDWDVDMPGSEPVVMADEPDEVPDTDVTVARFEDGLEGELSKLRRAIAALDRAFNRGHPSLVHAETNYAEPSYADLVSDTARRAAG